MTAAHTPQEGEIVRFRPVAVRVTLCFAAVLIGGGVSRAQDRDGRCPTSAASWAERCRGANAVRIVPVTCLAGRVVFEVTERGDTALRIDVLRGPSGGVLRAGGAGISPVGDFPDWPAESAGHHEALQRIASCLARDASVLDIGVQASDLGPHQTDDVHPPARPRSALVLPIGIASIAFVVGALAFLIYRQTRSAQTSNGEMSLPSTPPAAADPLSHGASGDWELVAAAATMSIVVGLIDAAGVREPRLVLALGPFACVGVAAFTTVTVRHVAAWLVTFGAVAAILGDVRYVALAYPAIAVGAVRFVHRLGQPRR